MEALGRRTIEVFGGVHVVCDDAGAALSGPVWAHTTKRDQTFYILTHPEFRGRVREPMEEILEGRTPAAEMTLG